MFKGIVKLILILNSNQKPWQIAGAAAMGFLLALVPAGNLLWVFLFLLFLLMRVNRAIGLLFLLIFRLFANLYDPLLDRIGYTLLTMTPLEPFWTSLYNIPVVPFTKFNDSLVLGGLIGGLVLFIPVMLLFRILVNLYRNKLVPKWCESKIYKKLQTLPWFKKLTGAFSVGARAFKAGRN
ncbi:MAG: TIGR03546 family protein [Spirochaetales bacterium]|nr:TIGR03546 family protein [Spirochaetales bacterium]